MRCLFRVHDLLSSSRRFPSNCSSKDKLSVWKIPANVVLNSFTNNCNASFNTVMHRSGRTEFDRSAETGLFSSKNSFDFLVYTRTSSMWSLVSFHVIYPTLIEWWRTLLALNWSTSIRNTRIFTKLVSFTEHWRVEVILLLLLPSPSQFQRRQPNRNHSYGMHREEKRIELVLHMKGSARSFPSRDWSTDESTLGRISSYSRSLVSQHLLDGNDHEAFTNGEGSSAHTTSRATSSPTTISMPPIGEGVSDLFDRSEIPRLAL